jgi:hypothetical protein
MKPSRAHRTPGEDRRARGAVTGKASAPGDRLDGASVTVNELVRARYGHHLATDFVPDLALALAAWDVAGYLRAVGATRADGHHRP